MAAHAIAMPRLGMTMEEGTVVAWPVDVGGAVSRGERVLVIETEKAESEIEATVGGTLRHVYVPPGETVACGTLLAALTETPDEPFDADAFAAAYVPPDAPPEATAAPEQRGSARAAASSAIASPAPDPSARSRKAVAPAARALAKKLGVDLDRVAGTGPGGRVTRDDVRSHAAARERLSEVEPGIALEVLREGVGEAVALLPGFGSDVSSFALQIPALAEHFEVVGINPRGVGASDAPELPVYEVGRAADDVAAVLAGPAHVVGASLGAATAIELALRHPERVRSLTLITPFVTASARLRAVASAWTRATAEASPATLAALLAPWLFGEALLADEKRLALTLRGLAQAIPRAPAATLERTAAGLERWSKTRAGALAGIQAPTLVLAGGNDLLTPDAAAVAAAIPGARFEAQPGCGHALAVEAAERVSALIVEHASKRAGAAGR